MNLKTILIGVAMSGMNTAGDLLIAQDTNSTGTDDVIGNLLKTGSKALTAFLGGDIKGTNKYLGLIRDALNDYLATQTST
jgi:hypothetical protein